MPKLNRFEWLKAVLQSADLNSSTKAVASALSVQFANDKTGQLNPSLKTLDEFLAGMSLATIKRCLKQLVEFGWLFRSEGRGAGNHTEYDLRAPAKIIPFRPKKKGAPVSLSKAQKGSSAIGKGRMRDLSYIKIEQSKEQNPALEPDLPDGRPSGSARGDDTQAVFVSRHSFGCRQWEQFTERMFGAWIDRALPETIENGERGYWLPAKFPPTNKNDWPEWRGWLIGSGWTLFAPSKQELCHVV
ncbi:MAG: helix-turn-helix domain-containing protein [Mangrovicoccus sp.]|nr:helix-turn-helix domain-containing protein [Mangrovicoccus sp.]